MNKTNEDKLNNIKFSLEHITTNAVMIREKYLLQQKVLNQLILKYKQKAKAKHNINTSNANAYPTINPYTKLNNTLNHIQRERDASSRKNSVPSLSIPSYTNQYNYIADSYAVPKQKETIKQKLNKLRLEIEIKKKEKAKEQKNSMMVLNDNIRLYQDQLMQENITMKKIAFVKKSIMNESMLLYKKYKDNYYKSKNDNDINQFKRENEEKEKELDYWKNESLKQNNNNNKRQRQRSKSSVSLFMTQKSNVNNKVLV